MTALLGDIYRSRELLAILVGRNLKIRYKSSALGFFWTLLAPISLILIYSVFLRIMRFSLDLPALVTGIIAWQFLSMCLGDSLYTIVGNASLVTKTAFCRFVLPLSMVLANLINFLLSLAVLSAFLVVLNLCTEGPAAIGPLYWLPFAVLTQTAACLGVALIISSANVFFRDTEHILSVAMLAWFFLTPIIYTVNEVTGCTSDGAARFPTWMHYAFFANPLTGILTVYRIAFLAIPSPGLGLISVSFAVSWLLLLAGVAVFQKGQTSFGDVL